MSEASKVSFPRRTAAKARTRQRIEEAARRLFVTLGYGDATMAAIADAADIHITTLFTHFASKRDLAAAAVLQKRMETAEKHYRDAMLAEDEEAATTASSAALTEIKAVIEACAVQKGCSMPGMLATYERLLKADVKYRFVIDMASLKEEVSA